MIKLDDISDAARQRIASEAAPLQQKLDSVGLGAPAQKLILGSSLREEMLTLDALQSRAAAAGALNSTELNLTIIQAPNDHPTLGARPGKPPVAVGRVRSEAAAGPVAPMATADDNPTVTSVSPSDLSLRFEAASDSISKNAEDDPLVRVLTVPAYHGTALSLYHNNALVGVAVVTRLQKERVYVPSCSESSGTT
ncbi:hypothetical protein [Bradyrhizobium sp. 191]|uniref:hypothetical protein n=1 Tax=Bradyrhizobium sp. 191 TaxID=2782659 RepID=UPI001FFF8E89|nr:hypothetical protein [Bradyrhizobium sp. 191]UPJ68318.1 hypothetical protein IVB23_13930 [Bradyrhizobium sp. 191]